MSLLNAVKKILDHKTQTQSLVLTPEQKMEIIESQKEIELGLLMSKRNLKKNLINGITAANHKAQQNSLLKQEIEAIRQKYHLKITPLNPN